MRDYINLWPTERFPKHCSWIRGNRGHALGVRIPSSGWCRLMFASVLYYGAALLFNHKENSDTGRLGVLPKAPWQLGFEIISESRCKYHSLGAHMDSLCSWTWKRIMKSLCQCIMINQVKLMMYPVRLPVEEDFWDTVGKWSPLDSTEGWTIPAHTFVATLVVCEPVPHVLCQPWFLNPWGVYRGPREGSRGPAFIFPWLMIMRAAKMTECFICFQLFTSFNSPMAPLWDCYRLLSALRQENWGTEGSWTGPQSTCPPTPFRALCALNQGLIPKERLCLGLLPSGLQESCLQKSSSLIFLSWALSPTLWLFKLTLEELFLIPWNEGM